MGPFVLTNIEGELLGFNNHEHEALVQKLPLCKKKHKELQVYSISLVILLINMNTEFKGRKKLNEMRTRHFM